MEAGARCFGWLLPSHRTPVNWFTPVSLFIFAVREHPLGPLLAHEQRLLPPPPLPPTLPPMRVLFVTQDFPPDRGGIQTYSWEVAHRLSDQVEALEVVAPRRPGVASVDRAAPFSVTRLPGRPALLPLALLPVLPVRARALDANVAVHAQWQTVGASVLSRALFGRPRRIACVAHGRELLFNPAPPASGLDAEYDRLRQFLLRQVDTFLPVSHYTAGVLRDRGVPERRMRVVPGGADPEHFRPYDVASTRGLQFPPDSPLLLTVGRLVPHKGIDTVLRSLPALAEQCPDVAYAVVGTGPDRDRLEALANDLGVRDRVQFAGAVNHDRLPLYYSAATLFAMPARTAPPDVEGFGLVFLEANACGTPVIGARAGGVPDAVRDGETGLLVPPDAPDALAEAALGLLTSPERVAALGQQGRRRVLEKAHWGRTSDRIYTVLAASA